jgi:hypothetical protein
LILRNKLLISILVILISLLFEVPAQTSDINIPAQDSYRKSIKAESYATYPDGWFYTLNQMKELYEIEYNEGKRLSNFIKLEDEDYIAECNGESFIVPNSFIDTTLRQLKELLDSGLVKYLFRLDSFHSHPFVTEQNFEKEYLGLSYIEMAEKFVNDTSLGSLFHNAEHLALRAPPHTGPIDPEAQELISKRNVIGWYDGRGIEVVFPPKKKLVGSGKSNTAIIPKGYRGVGSIIYKATRNGELSITHDNNKIQIDISLFECYYH